MAKQFTLRPVDIPVALRMAEAPVWTYDSLRRDLGISVSTAHGAVERLSAAGLMYPHARKVNRSALLEFLEHGVRYAFPAIAGARKVRGVPTAHAAPALGSDIVSQHVVVWPDKNGSSEGESLEPLYNKATALPERCRSVYDMLTLVDALRIGRTRERKIAVHMLRDRLSR